MDEEIPSPPAPPPIELLGKPPSPPSPAPSGTSTLEDFLKRRLESLEVELSRERERARQSETQLRQQAAFRDEADQQLKMILEQLKTEKTQRDTAEARSHAQGRIESLEKRLDEMHQSWVNLLKETVAQRDSGSERLEVQSAASATGLRALSESLSAAREELSAIRDSHSQIPAGLQQMISQFSAALTDRLAEMDRRISSEIRRHEENASMLTRERGAYTEAVDEQRHQIRQEYAKERLAMQEEFQKHIGEFRAALEQIEGRQVKDSEALSGVRDLLKKTNEVLNRPQKVKDQLFRDLEEEKRDLLQTLEERAATLRSNTLERRELERSLNEELAQLSRKLEAERTKGQAYLSQISELKLGLDAAQRKEVLVQALTAERDDLLRALVESTQKLQQSAAARAEMEQVWEARIEGLRRDLEEEKEKRLSAERQASDIAAKNQALADHLAKIIQDKDAAGTQQLQWKDEREKLLSEIRKKEDLLAMLSSTFRDLLKK